MALPGWDGVSVKERGLLGYTLAVVVLAACSSSGSGSSSPNKTPGQCVLSNGVWYCGTGYGNWQDCGDFTDAAALIGAPCDKNGTLCFSCYYYTAGLTCNCMAGDGGGLQWGQCTPSGTGCHAQ